MVCCGRGVLPGNGDGRTGKGSSGHVTPTSPPRVLSVCVPSLALGPTPSLWFLFVRIFFLPTLFSVYLPASSLASG